MWGSPILLSSLHRSRRCAHASGAYAKRPFNGPEAVLACLSRYTHLVAISNQRLVAFDERGVVFRWKDKLARGAPGTRR
jgi:hypothetical protein